MAEYHFSLNLFGKFCDEATFAADDRLLETVQLELSIRSCHNVGAHRAIIDDNQGIRINCPPCSC